VVRHLGNTISNSCSLIEELANLAQLNRIERILQQAAAQGIDVNYATGDSGDEAPRVGIRKRRLSGQSAFAAGVGGTSLALLIIRFRSRRAGTTTLCRSAPGIGTELRCVCECDRSVNRSLRKWPGRI